MADKVTVKFGAPSGDYQIGDTADLDPVEAKQYVRAGVAQFATVPDAKRAGADPETAATKK